MKIELLTAENFKLDSLDNYQRKQEVKWVYRNHDGVYQLEDCVYTEDWDMEKRRSVAKEISSTAYITYLALEKGKVIGFIGLKKDLVGTYIIPINVRLMQNMFLYLKKLPRKEEYHFKLYIYKIKKMREMHRQRLQHMHYFLMETTLRMSR